MAKSKPRVITTKSKTRVIPSGWDYINKIFEKKILKEPDRVAFRKATNVDAQASERMLFMAAEKLKFNITKFGTHYIIHHPSIHPELVFIYTEEIT